MNAVFDPQHLDAAVAAHKAGRWSQAEQLYREVLTAQPRNFVATHFLGLLLGQRGDPIQGVALIRKALRLNPQSAEVHNDLGELFRREGDLDAAARAFHAALRLSPQLVMAQHNLGLTRLSQARYGDAVLCFDAVTRLRPGSADDWHALGLARQGLDRYAAAIDAYRSALRLDADRVETLVALGGALRDSGDAPGAVQSCELALGRSPENVPALRGLAVALGGQQPARAITLIRRAVELSPDSGDLYQVLASLQRESGDFAGAFASYRAATALPGPKSVAYYGLSLSRKFTAKDQALIDEISHASRAPELDQRARSTLHFALGKVHDDLGRYGEAIAHFDQANQFWLSGRTAERAHTSLAKMRSARSSMVQRLMNRYDGANIERLHVWADPSDRPIFIIGMMRSGTTLVEQILASHPEVAGGGELPYWGALMARFQDREREISSADVVAGTRGFLDVLSGISTTARRVTDKMPQNFLALGLIHALFPNARVLHCRRDPVDTALSIYFTEFAGQQSFPADRGSIVAYYRDYLNMMAQWRNLVPADRFMEIQYEDMVTDQVTTSRKIIAFCGLEWDDACLSFQDTNRPIQTASAWQARQPIYNTSTQRWRNYEPWLGEFRELLNLSDPDAPIAHKRTSIGTNSNDL